MRKSHRLLLLAGVSTVALAVAGPALAVYEPQLFAQDDGGVARLTYRQDQAHDAPFRLDFYVPDTWVVDPNPSPGTAIGTINAQVVLTRVSPQPVALSGSVIADSPTNTAHATNQCRPITATNRPNAIWIFVVNVPTDPNNPFRIPVYVDRTTGAETQNGAYRIRACLANPNVPETVGGARLGAKLIEAAFTLTTIVPVTEGESRFVGQFTPWAAVAPNAAGTVRVHAFVRTPVTLTLRAKRIARIKKVKRKRVVQYFVQLTGTLTEGTQGVARVQVEIRVGNRVVRRVNTSTIGRFSTTLRLTRTTTFRAHADATAGRVTDATCQPTSVPPCIAAYSSPFDVDSNAARATVPRKKPRRP
jgi:hypothetical protein